MKYNRVLALILAFAILLGCTGLVPAYAATSGNDSDSSLSSQDSVTEQIQAPQYVDAEQFAQADHTERLYDEEQMNTYVYRNQDGSKSVYYMGQNVKYQHKDGTIRDKDTTLVRADRGYRMRDNDVDLHLPDSPADGITLAHGASSVKLLPQGGSGSARLSDNSILYVGYFGGKTILRYTPMLSGVKEDIILVSYTGQNSFAFVLETGGLYLYEAKGRYYLAESADAEAAFYLGQVVVYDAMGRPGNGSMTVETLISGQKYCLTLSADIDFLTDPETVYPVTIDPTLTVSYSVQGVNAIEDAPIYEGKPNSNYSNYVYDRVGYYDDEYKTARTVMRPAALLNSTEWQSIGSGDITSLTLHIKESSSKSAKQVNIHALTGNSTWTEGNIKWSNVGAYSSTVYASASLGNGDWAEFNLTTLAKAWKNGTQNENCGILLKLADESVYRTFYACEYSTIDYRPYMVLEYKQDLVLNLTKKDINEGGSFTLTATTQLGVPEDLSWSSNATTVASVSPSGASCVVTALMAGQSIITATATDADGETISATCIVYVKIPDGTYYICNAGSGLCMANHDSTVDDDSVFITNKNTTTVTQPTQFWDITYTHDGWYVIRPVDRPLAVLTANSSGGVIVQDFAQNATIQIKDSWAISWSSLGYIFKHKGLNALTAPTPNNPESMLQTATPILSVKCHWELSDAAGIVLRDTVTKRAVPSTTVKNVDVSDSLTLANLDILPDSCGIPGTNFTWSSSNSNAVIVEPTTGKITGVSVGAATITGKKLFNGNYYYVSYQIRVWDEYTQQLVTDFGFTYEDALLIEFVYDRVCAAYPNDNSMVWAWRTARVLGGIVFSDDSPSGIVWSDVAGNAFSSDEATFFTSILGFTTSEYEQLSSIIKDNYQYGLSRGHADFAHMQIVLAARLAHLLHISGIFSSAYYAVVGEDGSHMAGWLGDATLRSNTPVPVLKNDDYHADLDAENVYQLIAAGLSYTDAFNQYYSSLSTRTRADIFLSYVNYDFVKEKIYYELIDKDLYALMALAQANNDIVAYTLYLNRLLSEQYHVDTIKSNYLDTYDFLCSLRDKLADMADY